MGAINPPYLPRFGAGAPTGSASDGTVYYDTTNGYLGYIYKAGQWNPFGGGVILGSGVPTLLAPAGCLFSRTDSAHIYSSQPTGTPKTVVQFAHNSGHGAPTNVTLGGAPTVGNLLIANLGSQLTCLANIDTSKWTVLDSGGAVKFGVIAYRYVQVGDTATTPNITTGLGTTPFWGLEVVEIAGVSGTIAADVSHVTSIYDQAAAFNTPSYLTNQPSQLALLIASEYNATVANIGLPAGWTNVEQWTSGNYGTMLIAKQVPGSGTDLLAAISKATGADPAMYAATVVFTSVPAAGWTLLV